MESSNDPRILIGIGKAEEVESLVIRWPSGAITKQEHMKPGQSYTLVEPGEQPQSLSGKPSNTQNP